LEKKTNTAFLLYPSRKSYSTRQKIMIFCFFLFLSTIFWFLKALDNELTANITFPIKYIHHRQDIEMIGEIPKTLTLNLSGHGFKLLKHFIISKNTPIILRIVALDLNNHPTVKGKYYVLTQYLKENIQRQIGENVTLNYIVPDTLFFTFSPVVTKKVKVVPDLKLDLLKQFMLEGDIISVPDSIIVSGPKAIIDSINCVKTEKYELSGIFRSFSKELELIKTKDVKYETDKVNITVPVEKYTQASIKVPIRTINVPDSLKLITNPLYINIIYRVSMKNYKKINKYQFSVVVDYNEISQSINRKLKVKIKDFPYMIKIENYMPRSTDFFIESNRLPNK